MTNPEAIRYLSQHIEWRRDNSGTIEYVPFRLVKQAIELSGYTSDIIQNYIDYVSGKDHWRGGAVSVGVELERCLDSLMKK